MAVVQGGVQSIDLQRDGEAYILDLGSADLDILSLDAESAIGMTFHDTYPVYDGQTEVIPKANEETILNTMQKVVPADITVREVPYFETSNTSGMTAYIASEV